MCDSSLHGKHLVTLGYSLCFSGRNCQKLYTYTCCTCSSRAPCVTRLSTWSTYWINTWRVNTVRTRQAPPRRHPISSREATASRYVHSRQRDTQDSVFQESSSKAAFRISRSVGRGHDYPHPERSLECTCDAQPTYIPRLSTTQCLKCESGLSELSMTWKQETDRNPNPTACFEHYGHRALF